MPQPSLLADPIDFARLPVTSIQDWTGPELAAKSVSVPALNARSLPPFVNLSPLAGQPVPFRPGVLQVKLRSEEMVRVLAVAPGSELSAIEVLESRADVEFADVDRLQRRQFESNDPLIGQQWHHRVLGSSNAWRVGAGTPAVRIAIVDSPFQMDHPDLAANTAAGWDLVDRQPIVSSSGDWHATLSAGLAAAVLGNEVGVAGAGNFQVLPLDVGLQPSSTVIFEQAIYWAASNDVRIVSMSWTGGNEAGVNAAAAYLKARIEGLVFMAGVNEPQAQPYTNQPHVLCVSMTDEFDQMRSWSGDHIDFAAPGWDVYATDIDSGYLSGRGTSFSTPLAAGAAALVMSLNPDLNADSVVDVLKFSAQDLGEPGWDRSFGFGRVHLGRAAELADGSRPIRITAQPSGLLITAVHHPGWNYTLWKRAGVFAGWQELAATPTVQSGSISWLDSPVQAHSLYQVRIDRP